MKGKSWIAAATLAVAVAAPQTWAHGKKQQQSQDQSSMQQGSDQGTGGSGQMGTSAQQQLKPDQLQWSAAPPSLPPGGQIAVLKGNPMASGEFTIRLKATEDNYVVKPHSHSQEEALTVIKGTFHEGMGTKFDKSAAKDYPEGSFITLPANHTHFAWLDKGTIVQIQSKGPFDMKYVNPADDPRHQGVGGAGQAGQGQSDMSNQTTPSGQAPMGQDQNQTQNQNQQSKP